MTETITGEWETALAALREMLSRLPSDAVVTIAVELTGEGHLTASRLSMSGKVHVTAPEEDDDDSWIDTPEWQSRLERAETRDARRTRAERHDRRRTHHPVQCRRMTFSPDAGWITGS